LYRQVTIRSPQLRNEENIMRILKSKNQKLLQDITDGNLRKVKKLIANGADVHKKDKGGWGYLQLASHHGHQEIVKLLLDGNRDAEASVNEKTEGCNTALHLACSRGHRVIVRLLLDAGADPKELNSNANTALHLAVDCNGGFHGDIVDIVELLIRNGANVDSKNSLGNTVSEIVVLLFTLSRCCYIIIHLLHRYKLPNEPPFLLLLTTSRYTTRLKMGTKPSSNRLSREAQT